MDHLEEVSSSKVSQQDGRLPAVLLLVTGLLLGSAAGIGAFTVNYAQGLSYLGNDPQACANCHVMREQLDGWAKSSHRNVATCNDCHAPHDFFGKYLTKAQNGWLHSWAFTTGRFEQPIRITPRNHEITQRACISCHAELVDALNVEGAHYRERDSAVDCARCHRNVGHSH